MKVADLLSAIFVLSSCSTGILKSELISGELNLTIISGVPDTKTYIDLDENDVIRAFWNKGDNLGLFADVVSSVESSWLATCENKAENGMTSEFKGQIPVSPDKVHTLYGVCPSSSLTKVYDDGTVALRVPCNQKPLVGSFDPRADILLAQPYTLEPQSTSDVVIKDMRFSRQMAILKIVPKPVSGCVAEEKPISKLTFVAPVDLVGTALTDLKTNRITGWTDNSRELTADYIDEKPEIGKDAVFLLLAPQILSSGTEIEFKIITDKYLIEKKATLPTDVTFSEGCITTLNLSITNDICSEISAVTTDEITAKELAATSSGYIGFSGLSLKSKAVYSGVSAKNDTNIQLNSKNESGIVSTASGGNIRKVEVVWASNTTEGRKLNVYGKNTPYYSSSDLYGKETGTLLGSIVKGTSVSLTIADSYEYVAVRSNLGAEYFEMIRFEWGGGASPALTCDTPEISCAGNKVEISCSTVNASIYYTIDGSIPTSSSTLYEGIFPIESTITVNAIALKEGYANSKVASKECVFSGQGGTGQAELGKTWLEMPAASGNSSYYCVVHYATMNSRQQRNFSLLYDPKNFTSYWVAYPICKTHLGTGRSGNWGYDKLIPTSLQTDVSEGYGVSLSTKNYAKNSYSRGHQIPNADRNGVSAMQSQTYVATNCTPQIQNGFNGEIWNTLENAVRGAVPSSDTLYVVTGASFNKVGDNRDIKYITNNNDGKALPVPNYYWKVLLKVKRNALGSVTSASAIGVWIPHDDLHGQQFTSYVCSVDKIEEYTGFDFFVNLRSVSSPEIEAEAEKNTGWSTFTRF